MLKQTRYNMYFRLLTFTVYYTLGIQTLLVLCNFNLRNFRHAFLKEKIGNNKIFETRSEIFLAIMKVR